MVQRTGHCGIIYIYIQETVCAQHIYECTFMFNVYLCQYGKTMSIVSLCISSNVSSSVHMQDLESSVYYSFTHEIAKFQVITDELLPILKNYTAVLALVGDGYHYTGVVFLDLTDAYDTVSKRSVSKTIQSSAMLGRQCHRTALGTAAISCPHG